MSAWTAELTKQNTTVVAPLPASIRGLLNTDSIKREIARALPKHVSAERIIRCALTACTKTPKLMDCTQASFMECMLSLSQTGLEPDGKQASLIPYKDKCTLIIGYQGYVKLCYQSGLIQTIHADVICENDEFEYDRGVVTRHRIDLKRPRGAVYAVYAIAKFKDGGEAADVMTRDDVESIRKRSRAGNNGPWVTDWSEMAKKTVFRRLSKWLPQSAEMQKAAEIDDDSIIEASATIVQEVPKGDSKTDQLTNMLAARVEDESNIDNSTAGEESNESQPASDQDEYLSELALDFESKLNEPALKKSGNLDLLQGLLAIKAQLKQFEFDHLKSIVDRNSARLK